MTTWTCPICEGQGCSADHPCVKPRRESMPSGRIRFVCRHKGPHYEPSCSACFPLRTLPLESPQNAPASPAAPHGTSDGSKIDSRACPGQGRGGSEDPKGILRVHFDELHGAMLDVSRAKPDLFAGKPPDEAARLFWRFLAHHSSRIDARAVGSVDPYDAASFARLVADNRALTEQVTRLQEAGNARLALARIRKVLELPEGTGDQELVDEVARIRRGLGELWARAVSR